MLPDDGVLAPRRMAEQLHALASWPRPRPEQIRDCSPGSKRITERAAPGSTRRSSGCHAPPDGCAHGRRRCPPPHIAVVVKGYPACPRPSSRRRLGLERRGLARRSSRCATRPIRSARDAPPDPGARALPARVPVPGAGACGAPGGASGAGRPTGDGGGVAARSAPRPLQQSRPALRPGAVLAHELPADVGLLYAHYLHTPASVARYAAVLCGLPWCASAHARTSGPRRRGSRPRAARAPATTCTAAGAAQLRALAPDAEVMLTHHGLDASRRCCAAKDFGPDGRDPDRPCACSASRASCRRKASRCCSRRSRRCRPSCTGATSTLAAAVARCARCARRALLGLAERITWRGALPHDQVMEGVSRRRSVRAGEPDRPGRRPRWPAERAAGGGRAGAAGRRAGSAPCPS